MLQTLDNEQATIQAGMKSLAVSPDGSLLATGSDEDALVSLWRIQDGSLYRVLEVFSSSQRIYGLTFSPDGHYLVGGDGGGLPASDTPIWDVRSGRLLVGLGRASWLPAFRQDARLIASTALLEVGMLITDVIYLWDVASRRLLLSLAGHGGRVSGLVFCPNGHLLVTWSEDATVRWWDTRTGVEVYRIEGLFSVRASSFFQSDGRLFGAGTEDGRLRLWNLNDSRLLRVLQSSDRLSQGIVASRDGRYVLGWENGGPDVGTLLVWDVRRRREPLRLRAAGYERVFAALISGDGSLVVAGCDDQCVRVWSRAREKILATLWGHRERISSLALSPDLSCVAAGAQDGIVRLWTIARGSHGSAQKVLSEHIAGVSYLAFTTHCQYLASGDERGLICIWDARSGLLLQTLDSMPESIVCLVFDQQVQSLAACDRAQNIWTWKWQHASQRWSRYGGDLTQAAVEVRSQILPLEEKRNHGVLIWQLPSTLGTWQILQEHVHITGIVFHPNGSLLVAGYDHGTTCVWRLETIVEL